jgi:hypothetical protein
VSGVSKKYNYWAFSPELSIYFEGNSGLELAVSNLYNFNAPCPSPPLYLIILFFCFRLVPILGGLILAGLIYHEWLVSKSDPTHVYPIIPMGHDCST